MVYKPPLSDVYQFCDELCSVLTSLKLRAEDVILLVGDFNVNFLVQSLTCDYLLHHLCSMYLVPTIVTPTRVSELSATCIDNIFVSSQTEYQCGALQLQISDHLPLFAVIGATYSPFALFN